MYVAAYVVGLIRNVSKLQIFTTKHLIAKVTSEKELEIRYFCVESGSNGFESFTFIKKLKYMKKIHVIGVLLIAAAIAVLMSLSQDVSTFTNFSEAITSGKVVKISGHLAKDKEMYYNPQKDPCLLYTSPSPRDRTRSRMPSSA